MLGLLLLFLEMALLVLSRNLLLHVLGFCDSQCLSRIESSCSHFGIKKAVNSNVLTICELAAMRTCTTNSMKNGHKVTQIFPLQTWKRQLWLCWETSPINGLLPAKESVLSYNLKAFASFLDSCNVSMYGVALCESNGVDGHTCAVLEEEDLVDVGMSKSDLEIILQIKQWLSDLHHPHEYVGSHVVLKKMIDDRKFRSQFEKSCHQDDSIWEVEEELPREFKSDATCTRGAFSPPQSRNKILGRRIFKMLKSPFARRRSFAAPVEGASKPARRRSSFFIKAPKLN